MNTDNLISLADFAKEAKLTPSDVTRLISPQQIKPTKIGKRKFIDTSIYPPEDFKK